MRKKLVGERFRAQRTLAALLGFAGVTGGHVAVAADSASSTAESQESVLEEIVVTGTRLQVSGFDTPTPVTVIGAAELEARAPVNIADLVNEVPSFKKSRSDTSRAANDSSPGVQNTLDLRALSDFRTLTLINGHRTVGTNFRGTFDTNMIPVGLVDRVEVVTGGASAAYGSDAVAGVANFILKNKMQGLSGSIQGGVTNYGDGGDLNLNVAGGTSFANDRAHVVFGADYNKSKQVDNLYSRPWGRAEVGTLSLSAAQRGTPINLPASVITTGVEPGTSSPGGLVSSGGNPLLINGSYYTFDGSGNPVVFNRGAAYGTNMVGSNANYGYLQGNITPLQTPTDRAVVSTRGEYELSDNVTAYAEATYGKTRTLTFKTGEYVSSGGTTPLLSVSATTFPTQFASLYALGLPITTTTLQLGRINTDLGGNTSDQTNTMARGVVGFSGKFGSRDWTWDAYYQQGHTRQFFETSGLDAAALQKAVNGCTNTGLTAAQLSNIATYEALTGKSCAAFNPFGVGTASAAAVNYVLNEQTMVTNLEQKVAAASIAGNPVTLWAGDLSTAAGVEYRYESLSSVGDPVTGVGTLYSQGNFTTFGGSRNVKEGFLELGLPLLKDLPGVKALNFNGAARETDYSTSGSVNTWKLGATYSPIDALMVRATRSRDIRAPSLQELYFVAGTVSAGSLTNIIPNGTVGANGTVNGSFGGTGNTALGAGVGNQNLVPEIANTSVFGVSTTLGKFRASLDYYDVTVVGAIVRLSTADTISQCALGSVVACSGITFDSSALGIAAIKNQSTNVQTLTVQGYDLETAYGWEKPFGGPGDFDLRLMLNYAPHNKLFNPLNGTTTEMAGTLGAQPKLAANLTLGYDTPRIGADVQLRAFGSLRGNNVIYNADGSIAAATVLAEGDVGYSVQSSSSVNKNSYPGRIYINPSFRYKMTDNVSIFANIDNLLNTAPPSLTVSTAYDLVGRRYRLGLRANL